MNWDDSSELWEHQGQPLTVGGLLLALRNLDPALPVSVALVGGPGGSRSGSVVEIGLGGTGGVPRELLVTVSAPE